MIKSLEYIRNRLFWFVDFIKGKKIANYYNDIKLINENYYSQTSKKNRTLFLNNILTHSINTTKFYSQLNKESLLKDFPVVDKIIIRDNYEEFFSNKYKNKINYKVSTSGSTGIPFSLDIDKNKKIRNTADTIYFANKSGFKIGYKLLYIRFWGDNYNKSRFSFWKQNIMDHNVFNMNDDDIEKLILKLENDSSNIGVVAYASALESICIYLDGIKSKPIKTNIKSIILISESLNAYTKNSTKKYFGVMPISRYSNSENGIIAQQINGSNDFVINWASYIVEILNLDNDFPVNSGELGRIVITDLFNYSVPLIRYDTGDLGIMEQLNQNQAPVLVKVEGRKMDMILDTNGKLVSPHIIHDICVLGGIKQFQLIQEGERSYTFKINASNEFEEKIIIDRYTDLLGDDSIITIEYVDEIPLLESGKRKQVINLMKNRTK